MAGKQKYTAEQVIAAIEDSGGIKQAIAERLKCSRWTVDNYIEKYPTVRRAYEGECERIVDFAETKFIEKIKEGFWPAIKFCLGTKGKQRGYVEKREIEGQLTVETPRLVEVRSAQPKADDRLGEA